MIHVEIPFFLERPEVIGDKPETYLQFSSRFEEGIVASVDHEGNQGLLGFLSYCSVAVLHASQNVWDAKSQLHGGQLFGIW